MSLDWNYVLKFIEVAVFLFIVDMCWAKYFIYVNKHRPFGAAMWGSLIILFQSWVTIEYVQDKTLIVAAFIGGFIGTYLIVWREKKKIEKVNKND